MITKPASFTTTRNIPSSFPAPHTIDAALSTCVTCRTSNCSAHAQADNPFCVDCCEYIQSEWDDAHRPYYRRESTFEETAFMCLILVFAAVMLGVIGSFINFLTAAGVK